MRQRKAKKILKAVPSTYDTIGEEFDNTREKPIVEFPLYDDYLKAGMFVADIGCGNGRLLKSLKHWENVNEGPGFHYTGIDNSKKMLELALKKFPDNKFEHGDFLKIPLKDNSQDVLFAIRSFHHLPDRKTRIKALNEIRRVLRTNGTAIITVWNLWQKQFLSHRIRAFLRFLYTFGAYGWNDLFIPWGKRQKRYYHAFTPAELANLVQDVGFEIKEEFCVTYEFKVPFKRAHDIVIIAKKIA